MKKKTALITGASGQDGAYLAQLLLKKKYKVIGTDRRSARSNSWRLRRLGIERKIILKGKIILKLHRNFVFFARSAKNFLGYIPNGHQKFKKCDKVLTQSEF